jgi:hypothetical protein
MWPVPRALIGYLDLGGRSFFNNGFQREIPANTASQSVACSS